MSSFLWRYFFEDDVGKFGQVLASATFITTAPGAKGGRGANAGAIESPGTSLSTSPVLAAKSRRPQGLSNLTLSRADLNWKDGNGATLLHYVASSTKPTAYGFALALCAVTLLDLYIQDAESGWTALHRALYFGNVAIARMLVDRDMQDAASYSHVGAHSSAGGLIKIKDHEGHSPFDVYGASIASRSIRRDNPIPLLSSASDDDENENAQGISGDNEDEGSKAREVAPRTKLDGDEVCAFGSNKNFTLGFGDEDDRQFPERITLRRPEHLLRRLNAEHRVITAGESSQTQDSSVSALPALVQYRPIVIQDIQLSKLHSAVLTTDPEANLYLCGFGKGGRLGTGDETTRFHYIPIYGGGLQGKKIIHAALGQNHSLAISSEGELYAWGSNAFGQLGFASASPGVHDEEPVQLLPRQVYGQLKRELIIGAAASRIHSVVYTSGSLYTFGKNEGQLGLVDSDARSLAIQSTPRKVAASLITSAICSVSATDKATICLLENHDVWVLTNYGYTKPTFSTEGFSNYFLNTTASTTRHGKQQIEICKITSGGDTICALSSSGEVFTIHVNPNAEIRATNTSTTNPGKMSRALTTSQRVWSMDKGSMAVVDVDVGQDGSVIICTDSGSVWRRVKRAKIKDTNGPNLTGHKSHYKFSRVPGLTRIVAVRSNTFGAYAAVRKDCDVLQTQVGVDSFSLWKDLYPLLPLQGLTTMKDPDAEDPEPRFWVPARPAHDTATIRRAVLQAPDIEHKLSLLLSDLESSTSAGYDLRIGTTVSQVLLPAHEFIFSGRSELLRRAMIEFRHSYFFSIPELMTIEYDSDGKTLIQFQGVDFLTVLNLVLYMYTDTVVDVWHHTRHAPKLAYRYRQVRSELMKVASSLELRSLEHAVRLMVEPPKTLHTDLDLAIRSPEYFERGDVEVELDGENLKLHQALICQRCPFFEGLFNGRAAGAWLQSRKEDSQEAVKVDLKHVHPATFRLILRHIYADTDENLFHNVTADSLDAFLDVILEIMSVANELMLDRLAQSCQRLLGKFVNTRNVCQLVNAVAPCSVTEFKQAALEYICLNLEAMLENHLLIELDEDLILELDEVVRQNQVACLPFSKSGRAEAELFDRYPQLIEIVERGRRAKIDSLQLQSRLRDEESYYANVGKLRPVSKGDRDSPSTPQKPIRGKLDHDAHPQRALKPQISAGDLMFEMEAEEDEALPSLSESTTPSRIPTRASLLAPSEAVSPSLTAAEIAKSPNLSSSIARSSHPPQDSSWTPHDFSEKLEKATGIAKAWGSSELDSPKLDMKEIMAQTSSKRVSTLSSGLVNKALAAGSSPTSQTVKLSQKERKRQQQQQQLQQAIGHADADPVEDAAQSPAPKPSPWRYTSSGQKVSLQEVFKAEGSPTLPSSTEKRRQTSNPPLTMRQTVPGNAASLQRSTSGGPQQTSATPPTRSISTSSITNKIALSQSPATVKNTPFPAVRSIRHAPPPVEPSLQLTMEDILTQQQTEKDVIKDAVAKRSLQEIQEEQAFQEWWDEESRKVKEEEEKAKGKTIGPSPGRSSNSRGRSRGAGKGRARGSGRGAGNNEGPKGGSQALEANDHGSQGRKHSGRGRERRGEPRV